jgi:hypothetical protein
LGQTGGWGENAGLGEKSRLNPATLSAPTGFHIYKEEDFMDWLVISVALVLAIGLLEILQHTSR